MPCLSNLYNMNFRLMESKNLLKSTNVVYIFFGLLIAYDSWIDLRMNRLSSGLWSCFLTTLIHSPLVGSTHVIIYTARQYFLWRFFYTIGDDDSAIIIDIQSVCFMDRYDYTSTPYDRKIAQAKCCINRCVKGIINELRDNLMTSFDISSRKLAFPDLRSFITASSSLTAMTSFMTMLGAAAS